LTSATGNVGIVRVAIVREVRLEVEKEEVSGDVLGARGGGRFGVS